MLSSVCPFFYEGHLQMQALLLIRMLFSDPQEVIHQADNADKNQREPRFFRQVRFVEETDGSQDHPTHGNPAG